MVQSNNNVQLHIYINTFIHIKKDKTGNIRGLACAINQYSDLCTLTHVLTFVSNLQVAHILGL